MAARSIHLIFTDNGAGLSRDALILQQVLVSAGHRVEVTRRPDVWFTPRLADLPGYAVQTAQGVPRRIDRAVRRRWRRWDLNIFLESLTPPYLDCARQNCLIANQEWLSPADRDALGSLDLVMFKTKHAMERLSVYARHSAYIGFTSIDRRLPGATPDVDSALHIAGANPRKGTPAVVAAWAARPAWPTLTVVSDVPPTVPREARNIEIAAGRVDDQQLREFQNRCGLHVCPSEVEGFGHTLVEAMSCGAMVVTTDAPPMNELASEAVGVRVPYAATVPMAEGTRYLVEPETLAASLESVWSEPPARRRERGRAARARYEELTRAFQAQLRQAIDAL